MTNGPRPPTSQVETIYELLSVRGGTLANANLLLAPNRQPLTWTALLRQRDYIGTVFKGLGIGRGDRVAVVLPDGPELAAAFLTITSFATFAPLNPAYRMDEFEFYLTDLRAGALVVPAGQESPARAVARKHSIPILDLRSQGDAPAGQFMLERESQREFLETGQAEAVLPGDVALVLHTSGTTSRPKLVPLTHGNLCSSAGHIAVTLGLTAADRGLCVMPLFHIHGLMGALLSAVWAGGSVVCPPGFSTTAFFAGLHEFKPTWFSAVPSMHQAILASAAEHREIIKARPLRFIRSSSAALRPQVLQDLEEVFGAPVIESYGMTEASHQMASNPLPPGARKPGSAGRSAGPDVAILRDSGELAVAGEKGEIVIRGPNVTRGYENNPAANAAAFTDGWFRTGDQGFLDSDGYLFITGRLKEIINRGGEKIAPREIDETLLRYPGVRQAVAFAVSHPTLGEDIAAAVVPAAGQILSETELRTFLSRQLPPFKVPSRIIFLPEIPKGATGKIQRIGLGDRLVRELAVTYEAPVGATEQCIASVFAQVLRRQPVGRDENFFAAGGDSLRAMQVSARLRESLGAEIPVALLFQYPTPALLAVEVDRRVAEFDVAALANELEKLPAEEVARLLDDSSIKPD